ncbi:unnamed protein product, partial [Polarella glacialis]
MSPTSWRPAVAAPPDIEASAEAWQNHPRLQKHLLRFLDSPDPARVLRRYQLALCKHLGSEKLLRVAVHVGAWVALLPLELAAAAPRQGATTPTGTTTTTTSKRKVTATCSSGTLPSPAQLLAQVLRLRGRSTSTDNDDNNNNNNNKNNKNNNNNNNNNNWLKGVLHLVALRLLDVRQKPDATPAQHWAELRRSMPRATWRELRSQLPAMPVGDKSEAKRMAPQMRRVGAQSNREACPDQKNDESHEAREAEMIDVEVGGHTWAGAVLHEAVDATAAALHSQSDVGRALDHQLASNNNNNNSSNHNNNNKHTNNSHNDKAVLRFQLDGTAFSNATLEEQGVCIGNLEQRLVHAVASEAWGALCAIIREAAAALSAPRWKEDFPALGAMLPDEARERLRAGLQGRLRKLLCQGLGDLDLSDEGTAALLQPALAFMRRLFAHGGRPLVEAKAGKQWLRLQSLILCGA